MTLEQYLKLCRMAFKGRSRRSDKIIIKTKDGLKSLSDFPLKFRQTVLASFRKRDSQGRFI